MQKFAFAGEDMVLVAKAATGSTVTVEHTLPDKTKVTPDASLTEDASTGNFYLTFNHATVGTHLLKLKSSDDTDVDGLTLSIVNFATSNADIAAAIASLSTDVSGLDTKLDTISGKIDGVTGAVENSVGWV